MKKAIFAVAVVTATLLTACGSSSSASCCVNGKYYSCSSADAASSCISGDLSGCTADPSKDAPAGSTTCKE